MTMAAISFLAVATAEAVTGKRALEARMDTAVVLGVMDVQQLEFGDATFDRVFASFVFCSVPDPAAGLKELRRVCRSNGRLVLLEHMRPENPALGLLFDTINPLIVRMIGANINWRTMDNIRKAGWRIKNVEQISSDVVRWIEARPD